MTAPTRPPAPPKEEFGWCGSASDCGAEANKSFAPRLIDTYERYMAWDGDPEPAPGSFRPAPAAVTNPPYPYLSWPLGGSAASGYPAGHFTPLMDTLYCGPFGKS
jgi:hypothetical protein